jgi:MATE family multidrug resistance protein
MSAQDLPACRIDATGARRVDFKVLLRLAAPLMVTNAIQALLNLTDTWFIGHISTAAVAAISAIYWLLTCLILLLGGVGLAVQSFVSQADGAGRHARASQSLWNGLWASLCSIPAFLVAAWAGRPLLELAGLAPEIRDLAVAFWEPRMGGAFLGAITWGLMSFFNGIGATRVTFIVALATMLINVAANQWFIFEFGWGIAGSAWATNLAQFCGLLVGLGFLCSGPIARRYKTLLTWRPRSAMVRRQLAVGFPIGAMYGADVLGLALMQLMVSQVGTVGAAATQIVIMLTSIAYMPGLGLATAGTTVVGQAIGAGDRDWAAHLGTVIVRTCAGFMVGVAVLMLLIGPWLLPTFITPGDPQARETVEIALLLLWPAAAYQLFDGLYFGSSFCLRAAGDTAVPAATALILSWGLNVPLAHMLVFDAEHAWLAGLPQFGLGALGGWLALMCYVFVLGTAMYRRWRSERWRNIDLWGRAAA